jgi:4-hydroxybenzoate polyprenyltransferase
VGLHVAYSTILKSYAVIDIFAISFSFMIRAIAGEVVSGFHIPVWLRLTLFFMSLFVAAIKRNAELSISGSESRQTLAKYNKHFLDFLTYTFATATIIAYSLYAYNIYDNIEPVPHGYSFLKQIISDFNPGTENRKLMTATIPIVVYAIARYGQLFYTRIEGERPEKIIISDVPLLGAMAIWGAMVIALIYLL